MGRAGEPLPPAATVHELGINRVQIAGFSPLPTFGAVVSYGSNVPDYAFDIYDIPLNLLSDTNKFYINSNTKHHAAEVNWPGPVILVKFNIVGMPASGIISPSDNTIFTPPVKYRNLGVEQKVAEQKPESSGPITIHSANSHYFLYKDKPTILIGSNEHYGAVLNLDFDYDIYFEELRSKGLNYTRVFSGTYIEPNPNMGSWWDIDDNTLAPTNNSFISPWARSTSKGFAGDSNSYKFDLSRWDTAYFNRLRDFVRKADSKGIIVEITFFCLFWSKNDQKTPLPDMWLRSPMNIINNINNVGATASWDNDGYDMVWDVRHGNHNGGLTPYMGNMVTKVVQELNEFDNVIFQPCIESFKGDGNGGNSDPAVTMETIFEDFINSKIIAADTPRKHLISQNRDGSWGTTENIRNDASVISWDAGDDPDIVAAFYNLNKPMSNDEITYLGKGDIKYRFAGWHWIIGGAIFNMLDLSFTPYRGEEAGTKNMLCTTSTGGTLLLGGSATLRTQLGILKDFIHCFDFLQMKPDNSVIKSGVPDKGGASALVEEGKQYAIYVNGGVQANLVLELPAGRYRIEWLNPLTGEIDKCETMKHHGGNVTLVSPVYLEDIALQIRKVS